MQEGECVVKFTQHAKERCKLRGIRRSEVLRECKKIPKATGTIHWDNGRFRMILCGEGDDLHVITVFKSMFKSRIRYSKIK